SARPRVRGAASLRGVPLHDDGECRRVGTERGVGRDITRSIGSTLRPAARSPEHGQSRDARCPHCALLESIAPNLMSAATPPVTFLLKSPCSSDLQWFRWLV